MPDAVCVPFKNNLNVLPLLVIATWDHTLVGNVPPVIKTTESLKGLHQNPKTPAVVADKTY